MRRSVTARLSSQEPSLQNIPVHTELGRSIRRGFFVSGGGVLSEIDYSQIEGYLARGVRR